MEKMYTPSDDILKKYADVMINFALNGGRGIKAGEVALINIPECAKPFLKPLYETILEAGGHPIVNYIPDGISRTLFEKGSDEQINFFPEKMLRGKVDEINHWIRILSDEDPKEMAGIDPKKLMARQVSHKPFREWIDKKENDGKLSWTLCLYATPKMAKEANLSLEDYWEQIIKACYLEDENPVETWKNVQKNIDKTKEVMIVEANDNYIIRVKTGWAMKIGWYVGYIELKNKTWFFAMNMNMQSLNQAKYRKEIMMEALKIKGII